MHEPLYDPVALAEIALLAEVVIAATQSAGRLPPDVLDAVLGVHAVPHFGRFLRSGPV